MNTSAQNYNDTLADKITLLAGQINAANYRFLKLVGEFDRLEAWAGCGIRSCAHWLNWKCGISFGTAREKVRVARAMENLDGINTAFSAGEISYSKVRAMTRVATASNEEYLLMIAQHGTAEQMEKLTKAFRTVSRYEDYMPEGRLSDKCYGDGSDIAREALQEEFNNELTEINKEAKDRSFSSYQDEEGMWVIRAKLPAEEGGLLVKLVTALGEQIAANEKSKAEEDEITFPQRRADALLVMADQFLAEGNHSIDGAATTLAGSERCQLMLHIHAGSNNADNLDGRWLPTEAAKCLSCDASLVVAEQDEAGNVLNIGRRSRIIPAGMSRTLSVRDHGHCQFPGCCESHYVEGHHIQHWADGGETKLDNLVTLCRYHHRQLHKGNFYLSVKPDPGVLKGENSRFADHLVFSRCREGLKGKSFAEGESVIEANPTFPVHSNTELPWSICRNIGIKTAITRWLGERMDLEMAVDGLLSKTYRH